jgi:hypothetical protein
MARVAWFSAGVSSLIAAYISKDVDKIIYTHIDDQHEDSLRFLHDAEILLGKKIEILQSKYKSVDSVIAKGYIKTPVGAPCTNVLKRQVRKQWERQNKGQHIYIWGLDYTEKHRAERIVEAMPEFLHEFPLINKQLTKQDVHAMASRLGIKRPVMYDMGYQNNNCIGCIKGGMGYWNKIRVDFPDVFESRAKREREIGFSILKDKNGSIYLDELDPMRGKYEEEIQEECGIFCQLNL